MDFFNHLVHDSGQDRASYGEISGMHSQLLSMAGARFWLATVCCTKPELAGSDLALSLVAAVSPSQSAPDQLICHAVLL